jgi:CheY-like chemotaxis protein
MAGRVWVESDDGRGSTFHFTARFGLSRDSVSRHPPTDLARLKGLPVLVVDDNATNRRILQELLTGWGMKPSLVEGGREALAAMRKMCYNEYPFTIVLLDNMMPEMDGFMLAEEIRRQPGLAGSTLMMLSSADRRDNAARCRDLGVTTYLTKPIKRAELLNAILTAVAGPGDEKHGVATGKRRSLGMSERRLSLLLTEDNVVNQKLAVRLLEKRGHSVVVVGNGREALEALERQAFDVVLMDVQMPEMDGFEATAAIRAREKVTGSHVPIVAMTAHAMKGDRERCLDVGMDGYISKPLQPSELFEAVEGFVRRAAVEPPCGKAAAGSDGPAEFDVTVALRGVGGDQELLKEIIDIYLVEGPRWMAEIGAAVKRQDAATLQRVAHTLKGTVSAFGAAKVCELAQRLEDMGRHANVEGAEEVRAKLDSAVARLLPALSSFRTGATVDDSAREPGGNVVGS